MQTRSVRISRMDAPRCQGGESPLWDVTEQALYFIDNTGRMVHRFDPESGQTRTWDMPATVTALALRARGGGVVALRTGLHALDFETGALQCWFPLIEPIPFLFNDGKVDRRGRFLLGASTPHFQEPGREGGLFSFGEDRALKRLDDNVHFSNGPCWSPDGRRFYFSDSWLYQVYAYDYEMDTGAVADRRVLMQTAGLGGRPDGATVDADGLIWVALYGAGLVAAFTPEGNLERTVEIPAQFCSSVMFGGPNLDHLYVTTIAHGAMGEEATEGAGYLYRIEGLGVRGLPEPRYGG